MAIYISTEKGSDEFYFLFYSLDNQPLSCPKFDIHFCRVLLMEAWVTLIIEILSQARLKAEN